MSIITSHEGTRGKYVTQMRASRAFREVYKELVDIFEEEKRFPPINSVYSYRTTLIRDGWKTGSFWYFHALESPNGLFNLFRQHFYPIFEPSRQVVSEFSRRAELERRAAHARTVGAR
ncbi:hypothetical protein N7465_000461 [Penicillium sp. CMV-2018d]|nr:hypothetical protein N7465_000461 [Penicillium sp. CMV-2018d]